MTCGGTKGSNHYNSNFRNTPVRLFTETTLQYTKQNKTLILQQEPSAYKADPVVKPRCIEFYKKKQMH